MPSATATKPIRITGLRPSEMQMLEAHARERGLTPAEFALDLVVKGLWILEDRSDAKRAPASSRRKLSDQELAKIDRVVDEVRRPQPAEQGRRTRS